VHRARKSCARGTKPGAFFPGATANEKLCDLLLLPENAQQHGMCGDSSSANSQRLFDRFEAL